MQEIEEKGDTVGRAGTGKGAETAPRMKSRNNNSKPPERDMKQK